MRKSHGGYMWQIHEAFLGEEEGFRPGWKDADRTETWGLGGYRPVLLSQTYLGSYLTSDLISPLTSDK